MGKKIIIFTGPSGVGKATIEKQLFKDKSLNLTLSVSATTRQPRQGEENGKHYHFITEKEFDKKIKNNEFVEYNQHFLFKYGTLKNEIEKILNNKNFPFLEIETIGAKNIIEKYGKKNILSIFLAPPSIKKLKERIVARGSENSEEIERRMARVKMEMEYKCFFDHIIFNCNIEKTVKEITDIIKKEITNE